MKLSKPVKWHGGKAYIAKKVVALMPRHMTYIEPYAGGLSVLLERDPDDQRLWWGTRSYERGVSEIVGDVDGRLTNFWRVLQDIAKFEAFHRIVQCVPFSRQEWIDAEDVHERDDVHRAVNFFVRCRLSRAGLMKDFATISRNRTRARMNEQCSAWITCVDGLPAVHHRLRRVLVENVPATKLVQREDSEKMLAYLDPPYLHETRSTTGQYRYEMTAADHEVLLKVLANLIGRFILSGYPSELYADYANQHGWRTKTFDLPNNAAGGESKRRMAETIWMNY